MKMHNGKIFGIFLALLLIMSVSTETIHAQTTGKIAGMVTDKATGDPLPGVNIILEGMMLGAATDTEGAYFILNIPPGRYTLRAEMVGYRTIIKQDVRVSIDLTTNIDFAMEVEAISGDEVVVVATRPIVQPDVSGSQEMINVEEIAAQPNMNIQNLVKNQVSINNVGTYDDEPQIRGSSMNESLFIVDGVSQGDLLTNRPLYQVNLDAIQEVSVITGGFSARYGNLRSGIINVVTKEGGQQISASANIQYSPPGMKHFGPMLFGHDSPVSEAFVDVWDANGNWDPNAPSNSGEGSLDYSDHGGKDKPYSEFFPGWYSTVRNQGKAGWHYVPAGVSDQAVVDKAAMELYARWLWRHRSQDSIDKLKELEQMGVVQFNRDIFDPDDDEAAWHEYGVVPDYKIQATLGGPIPVLNNLKPTTFFLTFDSEQLEYAYRPPQRAYIDRQYRGKITSMFTDNIKFQINSYWSRQKGGSGSIGPYLERPISNNPYEAVGSRNKLWYPNCAVDGQQTRQIHGLSWTHTLSPSTYYDVKINHFRVDYEALRDLRNTAPTLGSTGTKRGMFGPVEALPTSTVGSGMLEGAIGPESYADSMAAVGADGWNNWNDWAMIKIGDIWYDEAPKGYGPVNFRDVTGEYRMESCQYQINDTYQRSWEMLANITSQVNRYNLVEAGVEFRRERMHILFEGINPSVNGGSVQYADGTEYKGAAYITDKLEFPGFIANIGFRGDWISQMEYPVLDYENILDPENVADDVSGPYSQFLEAGKTFNDETNLFNTYDVIPLKRIKKFFISPRLGIAHPISTVAKIFFNYGHMFQWQNAHDRYRIQYNTRANGRIDRMGNPYIDPARTIAYELGYEHNLFNKMSLRVTGYYKDINDVEDEVRLSILNGHQYRIRLNGEFRDTRGIEAFLELRRGVFPYFSGWASFNWMSTSNGHFGYDRFYEDFTLQPREVSTQVSNPDVRPIVKLNADFHTPRVMGPKIGDNFSLLGGINASLLFFWRRGAQFTLNPASIPLVEDNVRWKPYKRWDFRFTKDLFSSGSLRSVFYVDIRNLFDNKNMTKISDGQQDIGVDSGVDSWAWDGHRWWNSERQDYYNSLGYTAENEQDDGTFINTSGTLGDDKGDLPAFTPFTFLEKRDIWFGFKVYF